MTINLDTLRKTAEAATPGPWRIDKDSEQDYEQGIPYSDWPQTLVGPKNTQASQWTIDHGGEFMVDEINELSWPDAEFVATFDPPTVLALLSRLEQAEQAVQRVREIAAEYRPSIPEEVLHEVMKDILEALDGHTKQLGGTPTGELADVCSCGKSYWPCTALDGDRRG